MGQALFLLVIVPVLVVIVVLVHIIAVVLELKPSVQPTDLIPTINPC